MPRSNTAVSCEYAPGTILFREKEIGDRMYVIRSGRVKIYRVHGDKELVLAFLSDGDFLGEMALLEGLPRSATAMVVEPSVLIEVDSQTFEEMIRRNIEIAVRIMRKLASRVRALDSRLEKMLVENGTTRALDVLRWLLPLGILDEGFVRVRGMAPHFDIGAQAGLPSAAATNVLTRLQAARCLRFDGDDILIAEKPVLDSYAAYLDLKREYEGSSAEPDEEDSIDEDANDEAVSAKHRQALRRLLAALQLQPDQIQAQQRQLAEKYERFLTLKERFKALEEP
jgi:CRP-like cAMP-binding protein